jgi:hypothetical protein
MAIVGWFLGRLRLRIVFFSVPYAFVMLNLAAGVSLIAFLADTQRAGWKAAS